MKGEKTVSIILGILAIVIVFCLAYIISNDKKNINYKGIGIMFLFQLIITWFMFSTQIGAVIIEGISAGFDKLIEFGTEGINFVVGGFEIQEGGVFFFNVLLLMIFFATLLSVLNYLNILPTMIKWSDVLVSKITRLSRSEAFKGVYSIFFGQSEALLAIRAQFHHLSDNRLYLVSASAVSSVAPSLIGAYMLTMPAESILVALP